MKQEMASLKIIKQNRVLHRKKRRVLLILFCKRCTMRVYGFIYNDFKKMESFIYNKNINKEDNILIQVFTGVIQLEFIKNIVDEILSLLPQAEIIGTTTAGEIFKKRILINSTVISITIFEKTKIKSKLLNINNNEYELGKNISRELIEEDTKVLILFSEGLLTNSVDIIKGIQALNNNVVICGGKAGDNGCLRETFVFTKESISKKGVAAVSLTGKELTVTTDYSLGWSTIGKLMTVTKASKSRIYTIDNVKTVDIYRKYLGDEVAKSLPMSATEFPLIDIKDDIQIAKVPCACNDDGSLSFLSNAEVNDKVKFGYGNVNMLVDNSLEICDRLSEKNVEVLFVYSCFVRKSFMKKKNKSEISPLNNIAPTFGFFTYGEFFTINNSNILLNTSMTVFGLSERKEKTYKSKVNSKNSLIKSESPTKVFFEGMEFHVFKAFTKLVDESSKEIQKAYQILEEQKCKIEKMNIITKSILQINIQMTSAGEFDKYMQMILDKILDVIVNGKMACILLEENNRLCYKATRGYSLNKIKNMMYNVDSIYRYDRSDGSDLFYPMILKKIEKNIFWESENYNQWKEALDKEPKEILTCCIGIDEKIVGIINIMNTNEEEDFNEEDKNVLKYACYDIAIALKNYRLLENVLYMSRYDCLTGIYNRSYFREVLERILSISRVSKTSFIICGLDLNNFKNINDTYGHDKGDEILIKFAEVFKNGIGEEDILGRTGGDEFIAVFVNKNKAQVMNIIGKISVELKNCSAKLNIGTNNIEFAYGLSEFLSDSDSVDELLKIADKRMYEKKSLMKK